MNHNKLLIIGAGGHGKVCADIAIKMNKWSQIYFLDNNLSKGRILGLEVLDKSDQISNYIQNYDFFVAIGNNNVRNKIINEIQDLGGKLVTLIHPSANIGLNTTIKEGTVVMAGASINVETVIGVGVIINTNASVDHDCIINDFVHISPGGNIAGTCIIGQATWIGVGANVINNITIGKNIIVGAGSLILEDILFEGTYVGVPTKLIKEKK